MTPFRGRRGCLPRTRRSSFLTEAPRHPVAHIPDTPGMARMDSTGTPAALRPTKGIRRTERGTRRRDRRRDLHPLKEVILRTGDPRHNSSPCQPVADKVSVGLIPIGLRSSCTNG